MKKIFINAFNQIEVLNTDSDKIVFDFNEYYQDYYPACEFTTAKVVDEFFCIAGTDGKGISHLFCSLNGTVWEEKNITTRFHFPNPKDYGKVRRILYDQRSGVYFLISENGYLITLPDCPKCVRARKISKESLIDGWIEKNTIYIQDINGSVTSYSLVSVTQYRSSWSFAEKYLEKEGVLLDLRDIKSCKEYVIPYAIQFAEEFLEEFVEKYPKEQYLFFVCEKGYKADEAVRLSRAKGLMKSYSLGGVQDILADLIQK